MIITIIPSPLNTNIKLTYTMIKQVKNQLNNLSNTL
ncbi:hypothetical protein HMPREF9456_01211 [Dysgonomonas mossii DSM 22836]|uniref:Uncharacterized protein n=1 Tax=Dysgonomonas mossii DSM 22836 TaxID=742767 RepID=F8WZ10_9BACT|nr:hypothetical protein HMPREF9456_01211 [Dysgonomonas mossii DSM 22836]